MTAPSSIGQYGIFQVCAGHLGLIVPAGSVVVGFGVVVGVVVVVVGFGVVVVVVGVGVVVVVVGFGVVVVVVGVGVVVVVVGFGVVVVVVGVGVVVVVVGVGVVVVVVGVGVVVVVVGVGVVVVRHAHAADAETAVQPAAQFKHEAVPDTDLNLPAGQAVHAGPNGHTVSVKSRPCDMPSKTAFIAELVRSSSTTNKPAMSPSNKLPTINWSYATSVTCARGTLVENDVLLTNILIVFAVYEYVTETETQFVET